MYAKLAIKNNVKVWCYTMAMANLGYMSDCDIIINGMLSLHTNIIVTAVSQLVHRVVSVRVL